MTPEEIEEVARQRQKEIEDIARQFVMLLAQGGDAWMGCDDLVAVLDPADAEAVYRRVQVITESCVRTRQ
jgi:hypothetical protein